MTKIEKKVIYFSKYNSSETFGKTMAFSLRKNKDLIKKLEAEFSAKVTITDTLVEL